MPATLRTFVCSIRDAFPSPPVDAALALLTAAVGYPALEFGQFLSSNIYLVVVIVIVWFM